MNQPEASSKCDVCGQDTPHGHTEFDVLQEQNNRRLDRHDVTKQEAESPKVDNERSEPASGSDDESGSIQSIEGESGREGLFAHHRVLVEDT